MELAVPIPPTVEKTESYFLHSKHVEEKKSVIHDEKLGWKLYNIKMYSGADYPINWVYKYLNLLHLLWHKWMYKGGNMGPTLTSEQFSDQH